MENTSKNKINKRINNYFKKQKGGAQLKYRDNFTFYLKAENKRIKFSQNKKFVLASASAIPSFWYHLFLVLNVVS
jgi:hypothetical protein